MQHTCDRSHAAVRGPHQQQASALIAPPHAAGKERPKTTCEYHTSTTAMSRFSNTPLLPLTGAPFPYFPMHAPASPCLVSQEFPGARPEHVPRRRGAPKHGRRRGARAECMVCPCNTALSGYAAQDHGVHGGRTHPERRGARRHDGGAAAWTPACPAMRRYSRVLGPIAQRAQLCLNSSRGGGAVHQLWSPKLPGSVPRASCSVPRAGGGGGRGGEVRERHPGLRARL